MRCGTPTIRGYVSIGAHTIPLAPFLSGRGKIIRLSGGHPQPPGSGAAPRCTPRMHALGDSRVPSWDTLPGRHCEEWSDVAIWGVGGALRDSYDSGLPLNRGAYHPPSPLPERKGEDNKALWGTPPDPPAAGLRPAALPACTRWGKPRTVVGHASRPSLRGVERRSNLGSGRCAAGLLRFGATSQ